MKQYPRLTVAEHVALGNALMKLADARMIWTTPNDLAVVRIADDHGRPRPSNRHQFWCDVAQGEKGETAVVVMFSNFHKLVVRDGFEPQIVHRAFLKIDEYRRVIASDCEGAEVEP